MSDVRSSSEVYINNLADRFMKDWLGVSDDVHRDLYAAPSVIPFTERHDYIDVLCLPETHDPTHLEKVDKVFAEAKEGDKLAERLIYLRAVLEWFDSGEEESDMDISDPEERALLLDDYLEDARARDESLAEGECTTLEEIDESLELIALTLLRTGNYVLRLAE